MPACAAHRLAGMPGGDPGCRFCKTIQEAERAAAAAPRDHQPGQPRLAAMPALLDAPTLDRLRPDEPQAAPVPPGLQVVREPADGPGPAQADGADRAATRRSAEHPRSGRAARRNARATVALAGPPVAPASIQEAGKRRSGGAHAIPIPFARYFIEHGEALWATAADPGEEDHTRVLAVLKALALGHRRLRAWPTPEIWRAAFHERPSRKAVERAVEKGRARLRALDYIAPRPKRPRPTTPYVLNAWRYWQGTGSDDSIGESDDRRELFWYKAPGMAEGEWLNAWQIDQLHGKDQPPRYGGTNPPAMGGPQADDLARSSDFLQSREEVERPTAYAGSVAGDDRPY